MPLITTTKHQHQKGSVLLVALMVLIVLTLLTFSSSKSVILQEKLTSSSRDSILAFEVAETALLDAERRFSGPTNPGIVAADGGSSGSGASGTKAVFSKSGANGLHDASICATDPDYCEFLTATEDLFDESTWDNAVTSSTGVSCANNDPNCEIFGQYIVIYLGKININLNGNKEVLVITNNTVEHGANSSAGLLNKYKIIARGTGMNPDTTKILVSYFAAP